MAKATPKKVQAKASLMEPGKGSKRVQTRVVYIYGPPKVGKTYCVASLPPDDTKWIVSDSNCVPTLASADRLPPEENIYEVGTLMEAKSIVDKMITAAEQDGLGASYVVLDSITALADFHQQDVAAGTSQRFMGDNAKNNGWQQYNSEFGSLLDLLAVLGRYVTVVIVAHAKEKAEMAKGQFNGLNLSPQMALRAGRTGNWILYLECSTQSADDEDDEDDFTQITKGPLGREKIRRVIRTTPYGGMFAATNSMRPLEPEEPANLAKLLEKAGL